MKPSGLFLAAAAISVAIGCGGSTKDSSPNNGLGASGGTAGNAGSGGTAGGRAGASGSAGFAGGNEGGVQATDCYAPPESYDCEGGDGSFYFDAAAGLCKAYRPFQCSYGRANRFATLSLCLATCPRARPDVSACSEVSECVIIDNGCCGACEPVARDTLVVVNRARMTDFGPPCPPVNCGACPPSDELATTRQYFVPTCYNGTCGIFDVRNTDYTECSADTDCGLRDGADCCEGCDGHGLVSLNGPPRFPICFGNMVCPTCASIIPPEFAAKCQSGHCRVTRR